jgi:hypothetical protein
MVIGHSGLCQSALGGDVTVDPSDGPLAPSDVEGRAPGKEEEVGVRQVIVDPPRQASPVGTLVIPVGKPWNDDTGGRAHTSLGVAPVAYVPDVVRLVRSGPEPSIGAFRHRMDEAPRSPHPPFSRPRRHDLPAPSWSGGPARGVRRGSPVRIAVLEHRWCGLTRDELFSALFRSPSTEEARCVQSRLRTGTLDPPECVKFPLGNPIEFPEPINTPLPVPPPLPPMDYD